MILGLSILVGGCGIKFDTTLQITKEQSGKREIKCSLRKADVDNYVTEGLDGLIYIIRQNIPDDMDYDITSEGQDLVLTFQITFANLLEYQEKTSHILEVQSERLMVCRNNELGDIIQIWEDFTSKDLMGWLIKGLMTYHVIESEDELKISKESTVLIVNGKDMPLDKESGSNIIYNGGHDYGASQIDMATEISGKYYTRKIELVFPNPSMKEEINAYFEQYQDFSCNVTKENETVKVTCEIEGNNLANIQEKTGQLIGGVWIVQEMHYPGQGKEKAIIEEKYDFSSVQNMENCVITCVEYRIGSESEPIKIESEEKVKPVISYQYEKEAGYNQIMCSTDLSNPKHPVRRVELHLDEKLYRAYKEDFDRVLKSKVDNRIQHKDYIRGEERIFILEYSTDSIGELNQIDKKLLGKGCKISYKKDWKTFFVKYDYEEFIDVSGLSPFTDKKTNYITYYLRIPQWASELESMQTSEEWMREKQGEYVLGEQESMIKAKVKFEVNNILLYVYLIFLIAGLVIILLIRLLYLLIRKRG